MKNWRIITVALLIWLPFLLLGQLQKVATGIHSISAQINLVEGELEWEQDSMILIEGGGIFPNEMLLDSLAINYGELVIYYHLPKREISQPDDFSRKPPNNEEVVFQYKVQLSLALNGESLTPQPEYILGDIGSNITPQEEGLSKMILWTHILQDYVNINGELTVRLTIEEQTNFFYIFGSFCAERPLFEFEQRLPYYMVGGVGIGLVVAGILEECSSNNIYENRYLKSSSLKEANPWYDKANNKHHLAIIFAAVGSAIFVVDALLFYQRDRIHKRESARFERVCTGFKSLTFNPVLELPASQPNGGQLGVQIVYTF